MHTSKKKKAIIEERDKFDLKKVIGGRIKRARGTKSALWVAESLTKSGLPLTRSGLSQIENGKSNINASMLWTIAGILHMNIEEFFPKVPEASSFEKRDAEIIKKEDEEGAKFMSKAFLKK